MAKNSYSKNPPSASQIINALLDLSVRSRHDGLLSFERAESQTTVLFLKTGLSMRVDGYKPSEMRDVMETEMYFFKLRRIRHERLFRHMAKLAPAFGIAGSVIGLVGMLAGIGDTTVIIKTIPIALTSTLYGILLSNFILTPIAECIHSKTQKELLTQRIVLDGVIAISTESNTYRLGKKLESFMTPAERNETMASFTDIRERYHQLKINNKV